MQETQATEKMSELEIENIRLRKRVLELEAQQNLSSEGPEAPNSLVKEVFNAAQDAIFVKDLKGRYLLINKMGADMLGQSVADCIGKDDTDLFPKASAEKIRQVDLQVIADGAPSMIEEVLDTAAGRKTFLATKGPFRNRDGEIIGMFGISRDITERKANEESMRLGEERLQLAQELADLGTWDWDIEANFGTCSKEYRRIFGLPETGAMPTFEAWQALLHPDDREPTAAAMREGQRSFVDMRSNIVCYSPTMLFAG